MGGSTSNSWRSAVSAQQQKQIFIHSCILDHHAEHKIKGSTWTIIRVLNNNRETRWLNQSTYLWKCPNVSHSLAGFEFDYSEGSTQEIHWIVLFKTKSPRYLLQSQFSRPLSKTSFGIIMFITSLLGLICCHRPCALASGHCPSPLSQTHSAKIIQTPFFQQKICFWSSRSMAITHG